MAETTDLELAVQMLLYKTPYYNNLWNYYLGRQPLVYSSERLKDIFSRISARFTQNWCAVVVDSVKERLTLQRITVADDETATDALAKLLEASSLMLEADDVHLNMLVTGEGYVIVWPDDEDDTPQAYCNDSRTCHLFYEADRPRVKRFAAKWWIGDNNYRYLNLYYPDHIEYYRSRKRVRVYNQSTAGMSYNEVTSAKSFEATGSESNPYDLIPVFHFRRERRMLSSELDNVLAPQDAINKLLADMMIAAEYGAYKQRWIISNADTSKLKNSPNEIWGIPPGDGEEQPTSVGEFDITPLENYIVAIDKWTNAIAIISRTPKHYFFGQGGDPSGEALIAMESPLNHKCEKYIERMTEPWTEVGQFMARLGGIGELEADAVIPIFDKPQTVQPYTQALIRKESVAAGIPLNWQMKQEGYTEQQLDELDEAMTQKADADMERMAQVMEQRQSNFQQNGNGNRARSNGQPPRAPTGGRNSA